jgi:hypothetical protein
MEIHYFFKTLQKDFLEIILGSGVCREATETGSLFEVSDLHNQSLVGHKPTKIPVQNADY